MQAVKPFLYTEGIRLIATVWMDCTVRSDSLYRVAVHQPYCCSLMLYGGLRGLAGVPLQDEAMAINA